LKFVRWCTGGKLPQFLEPVARVFRRLLRVYLVFSVGNLFGLGIVIGVCVWGLLGFLNVQWALIPIFLLYAIRHLGSTAHITGIGGEWPSFRRAFDSEWVEIVMSYWPISVLNREAVERLDLSAKPHVFAVHPHGVHCFACFPLTFQTKAVRLDTSRLTGLVATVIFKVPFVRELFLWMGYRDARFEVASRALSEGKSLYVIPGGEAESLECRTGEDRVVLAGRKGFIRLALQHGAPVVPVYAFGLADIYETKTWLLGLRKWISKKFKICIPIFYGRWLSPMPRRVPIQVCFGAPVDMPRIPEPKKADIDRYHAQYVQSLRTLFDTYKAQAGMPFRSLVILSAGHDKRDDA